MTIEPLLKINNDLGIPMRSPAESQVAVWPACDIKLVGLFELRRIAIGRRKDCENKIGLVNPGPTDFDVLPEMPNYCLNRAIVAQDFFNRGGDQVRLPPQSLELVGAAHQGEYSVADQVGGGLTSN